MINQIKFEMLYNTRLIEEELIKIISKTPGEVTIKKETINRFIPINYKVEVLDNNLNPIFGEIKKPIKLDKEFYNFDEQCFSIIKKPLKNGNISYIILKSDALKKHLQQLKLKIFYTLAGIFIFMAVIGYFLSKLFLRPIREKIEEIDRFIEDTTHELNTPITAILMTIDTLKCEDSKKLKRLKASATKLSSMYERLTYSLKDSNFEKSEDIINLKELIQNRIDYLKILAESKKVNIISLLEDKKVKANREDIKVVIDNIITNAIKYSNSNGVVKVEMKDNRLFICDEGIGIKEEYIKDIFKRYKRFNKERGGLGIGLSIVDSICKKYNIGMEVKPNSPKGTCFILDCSAIVV
ncbi:MAG: HAMP domain-containing histidine kinase [Epsilonproteobacteria bacterium]|nr:HAMP domain-containing histidine kinase [Campylobacterota bacterium]